MSQEFHCHRNSSVLRPLLWQYPHSCSTSIGVGRPLSQPLLHCFRTSTIAGTLMLQDLDGLRTFVAVPPLFQHLHCFRTSTVSGPPLSLTLHWPSTSTVAKHPLLQQIHCQCNSTVSEPQCCRTSTISVPPMLQNLHCPRTFTTTPYSLPLIQ